MYCCKGFENFLSLAGQRGIAIVVYESIMGQVGFVVQSRALAFEDDGKLKPMEIDLRLNMSSIMGLWTVP